MILEPQREKTYLLTRGTNKEAVLTSTHNLCFEQKYETYQNFSFGSFHFFFFFLFVVVKFSIYLNRRVFVMNLIRIFVVRMKKVCMKTALVHRLI